MSGKSQALYKRLFEDLVDVAEEYELRLNPQVIMTDLQLAAINTTKSEFQDVVNKLCFFHTAQCIWRKIQSSGLASHYSADERFSLRLRHLSALAFLPAGEIPAAFDELKFHMPEQASVVTEWFESTYAHGRIRRRSRAGAARSPPLFTPWMWSVYESMHEGYPRTQNSVEACHRRWETVVGKAHMSVYRLVEEFRKEQRRVQTEWKRVLRGEPSTSRAHAVASHDERIPNIISERALAYFLPMNFSNLQLVRKVRLGVYGLP
ncbi:hypothetical protein M513_13264 [Trichuris suis]|uniref:MULE transposase domain-containing protein n=1 Tax=Trichuris suis TaxID=68888 RepID=A0A085LLK5_9BILA|nr:hypothetical protein M513_13264 [Trichuris suis]